MKMKVERVGNIFTLYKGSEEIGRCEACGSAQGTELRGIFIAERWRRRGYGSYLLKEILRAFGGYDTARATVFTAPMPQSGGEAAFWAKFGFVQGEDCLVRRFTPDLSAVRLAHDFLRQRLDAAAPRLCIDATCGNGGDTEFLCGCIAEGGRVLGFDIQPEAITSTRARLERANVPPERYSLILDNHANLPRYVKAGTADAVTFNFGWLPGADHSVYSTAAGSIPALEAALTALRRGGVLSAVLYSGQVIGDSEKQAVLAWLRALPLEKYTVLVCEFANWAGTAPLPCFVIKK